LQNLAHHSTPKIWLFNDQISHAYHHKRTTKTPPQTDPFSRTPPKNPAKPQNPTQNSVREKNAKTVT
jgi:hypothetical protein